MTHEAELIRKLKKALQWVVSEFQIIKYDKEWQQMQSEITALEKQIKEQPKMDAEDLLTLNNMSKTARNLFSKYKHGEHWGMVDKSRENIFVIGFEACALRYVFKDNKISPYNLSHVELNSDCCGVFDLLDSESIIHCNECGKTIHQAMEEYTSPKQPDLREKTVNDNVADADIEVQAMKVKESEGIYFITSTFIRGAKWMRDKLLNQ